MQAYISALTDTTSLTITVPKAATRSITRELFERNVSAKPIGLSGRFHSITNEGTVKRILELSRYNPNLRLPAAKPLVPLRSNASGNILTGDHLNESALRSILVEVSDWSRTIKASVSGFKSGITHQVIVSGMIDCIPRSVSKDFGLHVLNLNGLSRDPMSPGAMFKNPSYSYPDHAIAIIGMGCRFPGAKCVTEFWEIIRSGTSMLGELPHERFSTHQLRRSPGISGRFWGNFISDAEAFDHRFFKKSSREAASMDPQHRLALQVAYETLESSGYFSNKPLETDIGCYIGVAASDYEDNVGSHLPTAFSVTGAVRAFTSGKISHFFGWTGPSIVFDTACSSSAVAIHVACKAIQTGECSMALAGGVNVITSPTLHQNLAAANFISPTGASKPFDAKADGYCRGEGAGLVLLKKFSEVTKNENVLGVLVGSAVNQNNNSAPIVVPVSSSQSSLYRRVLSLANMESTSISFVEAHGPGTPKGDPIECQSIRQVFGEKHRKLYFGSVKGNIGHTEAASGVAALIKVILMIQHRAIPKQANFSRLNPSIAPLEPSNMEIPLTSRSWNVDFMAACINNYGAAGSNAAMIVTQPRRAPSIDSTIILLPKYPILISAHSLASVRGFCTALKSYVDGKSDLPEDQLLASIAFNLAHRQNRSLDYSKATAAMSLEHLSEFLDVGVTEPTPSAKPVVLVFGGQTGKSVSLSEKAFLSSVLLQHHLKQCDVIIRSMGFKGLFPDIFKSEPVEDVVEFHCMLFSLQYSCAMSWIDSGLDIATMIGHSFGQLTALCVAGSVSLKDSLKLIAGRASLIKDKWGPERGAMLSVELDIYNLTNLISSSGHKVEIACYNGPTSHVLVGTEEIISEIQEVFERRSLLKPIKLKRLQVTHGFHSEFTDAIMPEYVKLVKQLTFGKTKITLETCSKDCSWTSVGPELVAQQSRDPVYFGEAVRRIEERLGPCTWIEAGSATGATHIARRALNGSNIPHSFYPIDLGATDPMGSLADTTVSLWRAGINVQFWPFHHIQRHHYSRLNLPPYQFEKSRHWLTYIDRHEMTRTDKKGSTLLLFLGFRNSTQQIAEFFVDQADDLYTSCLQGHAVLGNALCPASLYVEIMAQAARFLRPEVSISTLSFEDLKIDAPLGFDPAREVRLLLTKVPGIFLVWEFALSSRVRDQPRLITQHAAGRIALADLNDAKPTADFVHRDRNIDKQYCEALLADADAAALQGSFVYKMFEKVVHYGSIFRGVKRISMRRKEVAGQVAMPASSKVTGFVCNPFAIDNFTQVAGLHVNSLESCKDDEVFVCTRIGQLQVGHTFDQSQGPWLVYSAFEQRGERQLVNDIFVFDPNHKTSVMKILDVQFNKIVINSLRKALSKANPGARLLNDSTRSSNPSEDTTTQREPRRVASTSLRDTKNNQTALAVRRLLSDVADIPMKSITDDTSLEEIGIDSLMATEALSEIKKTFDISISPLDFADLSTCKALCSYIGARNNVSSPHSSSEPDSVLDLLDTQTLDTPGTPGSLAGGEIPNEEALKLWKLVAEYLDVKDPMSREFILASAGLDSLLGIELENAVEKEFGVKIDITQMKKATTFGELNDMIFLSQVEPQRTFTSKHVTVTTGKEGILNSSSDQLTNSVLELKLSPHSLRSTAGDFAVIRGDFSRFAEQTGFTNFRRRVYPKQAQLVLSYAVETFAALGCPLDSLKAGEKIASVPCIPRHKKVLSQLYKILEDAALVNINDGIPVRTAKSINGLSAKQLYREILTDFPEHACEHRLLNSTGSKLADIVSGKVDPLQVLFGTKSDRDLLEEVYTHSPMFATGTLMLGNFLSLITNKSSGSEKLRILEIGAGTGGTTKLITELLLSKGVDFTYMFTDLSSSMVLAAKRKFAHHDCMEYMVLDIEREPPEKLLRSFHIIISSNCIHATRSILNSSINLRMMLRDDGFLCLLELTRSLFWLDCVFGMLEGWWLFEDGRKHILANEFLWERTLLEAGFKHVDWTDDETEESDQFRIIAAFLSKPQHTKSPQVQLERTLDMETVEFTKVEEISLCADIYYPSKFDTIEMERPIGKPSLLSIIQNPYTRSL